jgi:hypothetical protein
MARENLVVSVLGCPVFDSRRQHPYLGPAGEFFNPEPAVYGIQPIKDKPSAVISKKFILE